MTNAFSKTLSCFTRPELDKIIDENYHSLMKHNLLHECCGVRGKLTQKEMNAQAFILVCREAIYLKYGFKPNKILVINPIRQVYTMNDEYGACKFSK
tara:strand:+ start:346 stop:636 length:291 start_codon:yes stop_codon:yes gene_type:complete